MTKVLGIIPARGGSKRIIRKNMKMLNGKPLIDYTIDAAVKSELLYELIVSTDDLEILEHCKQKGVSTPFVRPDELSTDSASSVDVVLHAIDYFEKKGVFYDSVMLLQPTTPFRGPEIIDQSIRYFYEKNPTSVVSVVDVGAYHPHRMYSMDGENLLKPLVNTTDPMMARQSLPKFYIRSGDIYLTNVDELKQSGSLIGSRPHGIEVSSLNAVNIDTPLDFFLAESIMSKVCDYS